MFCPAVTGSWLAPWVPTPNNWTRSSQLLAVSVLGTSAALDFSHDWLFQALAPMPATDSPLVDPQFEYELPPKALNEQRPRVTAIDYLVQTGT